MNPSFIVKWFSPVTKGSGTVETTRGGVSLAKAEAIANHGNKHLQPLQYTVEENVLEEVK